MNRKRIITAAALAAALWQAHPTPLLSVLPSALGRYYPAIVQGMTATDDGNAVKSGAPTRWMTNWFFTVDNETR